MMIFRSSRSQKITQVEFVRKTIPQGARLNAMTQIAVVSRDFQCKMMLDFFIAQNDVATITMKINGK